MSRHHNTRKTESQPPWGYVPGTSLVHRTPALVKMAVALASFFLFLRIERPVVLVAAIAAFTVLYVVSGLGIRYLWKDLCYVVVQACVLFVIVALIQPGFAGVRLGALVGMKLVLFFFPVALWLRTSLVSDLLYELRHAIAYKYLFLVGVAIRFLPYIIQEFHDIVEAQRLRGVALRFRSLISPRGLKEVSHCLLVPLLVRMLKTSEEIRLSAVSRGLELADKRTYLKDG